MCVRVSLMCARVGLVLAHETYQHGALGETTKRTFCRLPASNMQDDLQALLDCLHEAERRAEDEETQPVLLLLLDLLLQAPLTTPLTPRPA